MFDYCYSYEETSGLPMKAPRHEYLAWIIDEWFETKSKGAVLSIEKARRLWVSWLLCCLDVWDAGRRNVTIVQGGKDYDQATDFVYRCWYIYEQIRVRNPEWDLAPALHWGGNAEKKRYEEASLATGSLFQSLNSNGEKFRGSGYARVKLEELSSYSDVASVTSQAAAVTAGPPGVTGGHIVSVANASANEKWQEYKALPQGHIYRRPCDAFYNQNGVRCLWIHYHADPDKDAKWAAEEFKRGWTLRNWKREMEMDDTIHEGTPMFEDYFGDTHCPGPLRSNSWQTRTGSKYFLGLDAGGTLWPGAVLLEVSPYPYYQICAMYEWTFVDGNTPISRAIPKILNGGEWDGRKYLGLRAILPGLWTDVKWHADRSVLTRDGNYGKTAQMVALQDFNVSLIPVSNEPDARYAAVDKALTQWIEYQTTDEYGRTISDRAPRFYICGKDCPMLKRGFEGAYKTVAAPNKGSGVDRRDPVKDVYSHVADGLQYALLAAWEWIKRDTRAREHATSGYIARRRR